MRNYLHNRDHHSEAETRYTDSCGTEPLGFQLRHPCRRGDERGIALAFIAELHSHYKVDGEIGEKGIQL